MIEVSQAIGIAQRYLETVFQAEGPRHVRLEEVELSEDNKFWSITFSFDRSSYGGTMWTKEYKLVKVDAETGQTRGIQIRELGRELV